MYSNSRMWVMNNRFRDRERNVSMRHRTASPHARLLRTTRLIAAGVVLFALWVPSQGHADAASPSKSRPVREEAEWSRASSDAAEKSPWLDIPLVDQGGKATTLGGLRGKLVVVSFVFASCPGCL